LNDLFSSRLAGTARFPQGIFIFRLLLVMNRSIEVQGHRGARALRPENTLPSFEAALDVGVDSIETDLQLTRDGRWILHHDALIRPDAFRVFRDGRRTPVRAGLPVHRCVSATLQRFCIDANPDPIRFPRQVAKRPPLSAAFAAEYLVAPHEPYAIPLLPHLFLFVQAYAAELGARNGKTAIQRAKAEQVILDLEIKSEPFSGRVEPIHLERLAALIVAAQLTTRCRVRSFDHRLVNGMKKVLPELTTAVLVTGTAPVNPVRLAVDAQASIYCPDYRFLDREQVKSLHNEGIRVLPWTVNAPSDWQRLIDWGVDGITTDDPGCLIKWPKM
jgi:glycerophosphoryl diester phosphodiesterase